MKTTARLALALVVSLAVAAPAFAQCIVEVEVSNSDSPDQFKKSPNPGPYGVFTPEWLAKFPPSTNSLSPTTGGGITTFAEVDLNNPVREYFIEAIEAAGGDASAFEPDCL